MRSLYTFYCSRSGQADTRLAELMRDPAHAKALQNCWDSIQPFTHAWDLASMLIKPVQRIMKYPMLFKELLAATTPAHPDYFNLKQAAASASAVADEVNEVKRRKDLVEKAISQVHGAKHSSATSPTTPVNKETRLSFKLTKRFGKNKEKEKEKERASPLVGSLSHLTISPASEAEVATSIRRLESSKACVQQLGEEIERFPEVVRNYWFTQLNVATAWHQAYTLDTTDMIDRRLQVYRNMMELILKYPYVKLVSPPYRTFYSCFEPSFFQNKDIKYKVIPVLEVLGKITVNPLAVISRFSSRRGYYSRVQAALAQNDVKSLDRETIQNAEDYVSLHAQLLEELPPFLEGMEKLLEILLGAFSLAQKDYFNGMQAHIRRFFYTVKLPVWEDGADTDDTTRKRPESGSGSVPDGTTIMQIWYNAWTPVHEGIRTLGLVSSTSLHPASVSDVCLILSIVTDTGPLSASSSRLVDTASSNSSLALPVPPTGGLARPISRSALRAPLSRNSSFTSAISKSNRARSSSLLAPASVDAPGQPAGNAISASRPYLRHSRTLSTSSINLPSPSTTGQSNSDGSRLSMQRTTGNTTPVGRETSKYNLDRLARSHLPPVNATQAITLPDISEMTRVPPPYEQQQQLPSHLPTNIPVAQWEAATLLYRCVCVANFQVYAHVRYGTLPFLMLNEGDIIEYVPISPVSTMCLLTTL